MEIRLLGPVGLWRGGREIPLAGPQQRCVLAVLSMSPGRPVPLETLVDRLWGDQPPRQARHSVYTHVSAVRRVLDRLGDDHPDAALRRLDGGYSLQIDPDGVDLHRTRGLAQKARTLGGGPDSDWQAVKLLREACSLWRGVPLLGLAPDWATRTRAALIQEWLALLGQRFTVELRVGEHEAAIGELAALLADHPLVEPLVSLQMLALYRCGRQAEALDLYARTRQWFVDELGDEPSTVLRRLHEQILRRDPALDLASDRVMAAGRRPAQLVRPAQLPPDVVAFTGREHELTELDGLRNGAGDQPAAVVISAIDGMAGVGKSALAIHWAHRVREHFPDGQLYVNLYGCAPRPPLPALDALARFLRALGVSGQKVPAETDEAAAMYRSLLADKTVLVVLDNAASPDQVRPLLPSGGGSMVLVTSRDQLDGLVAREGARRLSVDILAPEEAHALLARTIGGQPTRAEPDAVAELAELCGHLPLALRIAVANLTVRPQTRISTYVARLRDASPLATLTVAGDSHVAVAAAFDLSYARLPAESQRLFRLLALAPGPDITAQAAAALAAMTATDAERLLQQLASAHLLEEHAPGRYACHDLLRHYATERGSQTDTQADREAAQRRLYDYYLDAVDAAAGLLFPEKLRLPNAPARRPSVHLRDHAHALAWLDEELPSLVATVKHTGSHGPRPVAWRLADGLRGYHLLRRSIVEWLSIARAALAAAQADGHLYGQAASLLSLADAHQASGKHPEAIVYYLRALQIGEELAAPHIQAACLNNLGIVHQRSGRPREAVVCYERALALTQRAGAKGGSPVMLGNLGSVHRELGRLRESASLHARALATLRSSDGESLAGEANELRELGETCHVMGRYVDAREHFEQALVLFQRVGDRPGEANTQRCLAAVHRDTGSRCLELARTALANAREAGSLEVEADALITLGSVHQQLAEPRQAVDHHQQALRIARESGLGRCKVEALIEMATAYNNLGNRLEAGHHVEQALAITGDAGLRILEGRARAVRALLHLDDGELDRARALGEHALEIHTSTGHRPGEAHAHVILGHVHLSTGDITTARGHAEQAQALFAAIGTPEPDELSRLLRSRV